MAALLQPFRRFARYNTLANRRLYEACAGLGDAERRRDRRGFFGSVHGTLNHILLGDRIWMTRFEGAAAPPTPLDAELYADFADLTAARVAEDRRIEGFVAGLAAADLDRAVRYSNSAGHRFDDPLSLVLLHLFNHQTHHRGQVHDMLSQIGPNPLVLDMHRVLKPDPAAPVSEV